MSWDVDGTLYALPQLVRAMYGLYAKRLIDPQFVQNLREITKLWQYRRSMARVRSAGGKIDAETAKVIMAKDMAAEQRWYGQAIQSIGPRPGIVETIQRIDEVGIRQVVISDYVCDYKLRALGMGHCFERLFAGEELGMLKPSPELFLSVAPKIGVTPEQILHIGDRADTDGVAAQKAGCKSLILGDNDPLDFLIRTDSRRP